MRPWGVPWGGVSPRGSPHRDLNVAPIGRATRWACEELAPAVPIFVLMAFVEVTGPSAASRHEDDHTTNRHSDVAVHATTRRCTARGRHSPQKNVNGPVYLHSWDVLVVARGLARVAENAARRISADNGYKVARERINERAQECRYASSLLPLLRNNRLII